MKVPRYSASQLKNYDPEAGGCNRKWFFKSIMKLPDPVKASAQLGTDMHARLEAYFRHGTPLPDDKPGKIAASGVHLLPSTASTFLRLSRRSTADSSVQPFLDTSTSAGTTENVYTLLTTSRRATPRSTGSRGRSCEMTSKRHCMRTTVSKNMILTKFN